MTTTINVLWRTPKTSFVVPAAVGTVESGESLREDLEHSYSSARLGI